MAPNQQGDALPSSVHTEVTVLGAMLLDGPALRESLSRLSVNDFSLDTHQRIFRTMMTLMKAGHGTDYITVMDELSRRKELDAVGGPAYLAYLSEGIPRNPKISDYIRIIKDKAKLRRLLSVFNDGMALASDQNEDPTEILDNVQRQMREAMGDEDGSDLQSVGQFLDAQGPPDAMFEHLSALEGIKSGFSGLDECLGGFQPGELIIVAARPSVGKTAWACNVGSYIAVRNGQTVAMFTLEQKRQAIIRRMLSASSRVDYKLIKERRLRSEDRALLLERHALLSEAPLFITDAPRLTTTRIHSMCANMQAKKGLDIVLIDQLSKVSRKDLPRGMPKHEQVGEQTNALKIMAQELNVPVVLFNQLGREVAKRSDPRPVLSDLKESGNIEEDADVVIFLHRLHYYDKTADPNEAEIIVAKQREGDTKTIHVNYQGKIMRWEDTAAPAATQEDLAY